MNRPTSQRVTDFYKKHRRLFILGTIFIASSALIYFTHYHIFHNPRHIFIFMVSDLAFLPFPEHPLPVVT